MAPPNDVRVATLRVVALPAPDRPFPFREKIYIVLKRAIDVLLSVLVLTAFAPLLVGVAILVRLDSPGPVLFRQVRNGQYGRRFRMYKFRTMYWDAPDLAGRKRERHVVAPTERKPQHDARVTRVGMQLRQWSIDEMPNLLNVLRGEMSIVGPRPASFAVESYGAAAPQIVRVKPGVTGLWQVSGRGDLPFSDRIALDCEYVRRRSLRLDLSILLKTIGVVLSRRGAY